VLGAVNCVVPPEGQYTPENHRGAGFLAALRTVADPAGKSFVVLGAGGAARAIAVEAGFRRGAVITIRSRHAVCAPSSAARSAPLTAEGHTLDETIGRERLSDMEREHRQHRTLLWRAERERAAFDARLDRP
jgi:shikimate dehydrogenase